MGNNNTINTSNKEDAKKRKKRKGFQHLIEIMDILRGTKGCPWDKEQTMESLKPFLIEEAYEVIDAIDKNDYKKIKEELGDLLYQIIFHARIAKERGEFTIYDVIAEVIDKMIRRHPHVFADSNVKDSKEVLAKWERIKDEEEGNSAKKSVLDGIPEAMPVLLRAKRLQEKAARYNFDWDNPVDIMKKIKEEVSELEEELSYSNKISTPTNNSISIEHEIGDVFFAVVNLARFINIDPDTALKKASERFVKRFNHIERCLAERGTSIRDAKLEEMEILWNEAKLG